MNQLQAYIYPFPLEPPSHHLHPTLHRAVGASLVQQTGAEDKAKGCLSVFPAKPQALLASCLEPASWGQRSPLGPAGIMVLWLRELRGELLEQQAGRPSSGKLGPAAAASRAPPWSPGHVWTLISQWSNYRGVLWEERLAEGGRGAEAALSQSAGPGRDQEGILRAP